MKVLRTVFKTKKKMPFLSLFYISLIGLRELNLLYEIYLHFKLKYVIGKTFPQEIR